MAASNDVWLAKIKEFRSLKAGGSQHVDDNLVLDILEVHKCLNLLDVEFPPEM